VIVLGLTKGIERDCNVPIPREICVSKLRGLIGHALTQPCVAHGLSYDIGRLADISTFDEPSCDAVDDVFGRRPQIAGNNRKPEAHRVSNGEAERLWNEMEMQEHVGSLVRTRHVVGRNLTEKFHVVLDPVGLYQQFEIGKLRPIPCDAKFGVDVPIKQFPKDVHAALDILLFDEPASGEKNDHVSASHDSKHVDEGLEREENPKTHRGQEKPSNVYRNAVFAGSHGHAAEVPQASTREYESDEIVGQHATDVSTGMPLLGAVNNGTKNG
jgi:hypothetical protein